MIENIIIISFIVGVIIYYVYSNNVEGFGISSPRMRQICGNGKCGNKDIEKRLEVHHSSAYEIGHDDDNNKVFQFKGKMFKMNEDNVLEINEPKKVTYKEVPIALPIAITADKIESTIPLKYNGYTFTGLVSNEYYKQYYILYEKEYEEEDLKLFKEKLYFYILAKKTDNNLDIIHNIPPRRRVIPGDNIYFAYGNFELGPLKFI
jgi:hypothetical protein